MAEQQVKVVINGEDKTGPAFKGASKNVSLLNTDVTGLTKVIGGGLLAAGAGLTAFLYSAAKGAAEAEVSMAKVTATLKAMGPAALKNKEALLAHAQAAVQMGFDDEAAAESLAKLYQRTNDLTKANELNNLAMDLARAKNIDLATATDMVGMVLSGNGRALKAYGIEISDTMTPLQALGELHDKVGGQAEAFAHTYSGQMSILNESVSNLKDTIGASILEAINPFVTQLAAWASNPDVQKKVQEIANMIGEFATVTIPVVIDAVKIMYGWFQGIVEVLGEIIYQVMRAIDVIERFVAASKKIGSNVINSVKSIFGKEIGGSVATNTPYLVGERGPELFVPSSFGRIVPNNQLAGAGGGITINITGNTLLDKSAGEKISNQLMQALKNNLRI